MWNPKLTDIEKRRENSDLRVHCNQELSAAATAAADLTNWCRAVPTGQEYILVTMCCLIENETRENAKAAHIHPIGRKEAKDDKQANSHTHIRTHKGASERV